MLLLWNNNLVGFAFRWQHALLYQTRQGLWRFSLISREWTVAFCWETISFVVVVFCFLQEWEESKMGLSHIQPFKDSVGCR